MENSLTITRGECSIDVKIEGKSGTILFFLQSE